MKKVRTLDENKELRLILQGVAAQHGVSLEQVKRDIQEAINDTWDNPDPAIRARQRRLFPNGKPTIAEFIYRMAQEVQETDE